MKKNNKAIHRSYYVKITSSTIDRVVYYNDSITHPHSGALTVYFINGGVYKYDNVSKKEFTDFLRAESRGSWFHHHIRTLKTYTKIK